MSKLSRWIVVDGYCATRIIEGGSIDNIADRVAFIEKTPRVRVGQFTADEMLEQDNWLQGPKGLGGSDGDNPDNELYGFFPPSRDWCDFELVKRGYELG